MGPATPNYATNDAVRDYLTWQSYLEAAKRHYDVPDQSEDFQNEDAHDARRRVLDHQPVDVLGAFVLVSIMLEEIIDGGEVTFDGMKGLHTFLMYNLKAEIDAVWARQFAPSEKVRAETFLINPLSYTPDTSSALAGP